MYIFCKYYVNYCIVIAINYRFVWTIFANLFEHLQNDIAKF